jgi:hypothetical protein
VTRFIEPEAYWDVAAQTVRDCISQQELPNYSGLCLFVSNGQPLVMNTGVRNGARFWQYIASGPALKSSDLERNQHGLPHKSRRHGDQGDPGHW